MRRETALDAKGLFVGPWWDQIIQGMTIAQDEKVLKHMWEQPEALHIVLQESGLWPKGGLYFNRIAGKQNDRGE